MDSLIVRAAARIMLPLLILFSIFMLLRGHNSPGGGFVGGLVAAIAIILLSMAGGLRDAEVVFPAAHARWWMALGLALAGSAATLPLLFGHPFMKGLWQTVSLPGLGELEIGTPVIFDVGVYIVVLGMTLTVVLRLMGQVEQSTGRR